jgi:hypothetical protein
MPGLLARTPLLLLLLLFRLTPPYALVIFFYATLLPHLGSGPLWNQWVGVNKVYCVAHWWTNLLYINNYVSVSEMVTTLT